MGASYVCGEMAHIHCPIATMSQNGALDTQSHPLKLMDAEDDACDVQHRAAQHEGQQAIGLPVCGPRFRLALSASEDGDGQDRSQCPSQARVWVHRGRDNEEHHPESQQYRGNRRDDESQHAMNRTDSRRV